MRKILFIVVLAIIGAGLWYAMREKTPTPPTNTVTNNEPVSTTHPSLENATFKFDGTAVKLKNGNATTLGQSDSASDTIYELTKVKGYGDINEDGKEDVVGVIVQSGSGSGIFLSVIANVSGPISYKGTDAFFLGDRIDPKSISIKGGVITVSYLDRKPDDAFAEEPTIPKTATLIYNEALNTLEER